MTKEIITSEIVSSDSSVVAGQEKKKPVSTNKEFKAHMATSALDFAAMRDQSLTEAKERNPDLKVEESSRRAKYGVLGMAADTHMRCNGLLSGMTDAELKVIKLMNITAEKLAADPKAGGFSREHKLYIPTIAACLTQKKRPDSIDLSKANEALKAIDPQASTKKTGHKSISYLIDMLQDKMSWTLSGWKAETGAETTTQASYIAGFLAKTGLATVSGQGDSKTVTPNQEHPVIQALIAIK